MAHAAVTTISSNQSVNRIQSNRINQSINQTRVDSMIDSETNKNTNLVLIEIYVAKR